MIERYLRAVCEEYSLRFPRKEKTGVYPLSIGDETILVKNLEPGISFFSVMRKLPEKKKEDLFLYLMRANLLGQGTGNCRIGIEEKEEFLTLSLGLPYEMSYQVFQESLEDFVNYLNFWREEVTKWENEE